MAKDKTGAAREMTLFDDPNAAVARIIEIYDTGVARMLDRFGRFAAGDPGKAGFRTVRDHLRTRVTSVGGHRRWMRAGAGVIVNSLK